MAKYAMDIQSNSYQDKILLGRILLDVKITNIMDGIHIKAEPRFFTLYKDIAQLRLMNWIRHLSMAPHSYRVLSTDTL